MIVPAATTNSKYVRIARFIKSVEPQSSLVADKALGGGQAPPKEIENEVHSQRHLLREYRRPDTRGNGRDAPLSAMLAPLFLSDRGLLNPLAR